MRKENAREIKRFFIGIAVLCLFLALLILAMMLQPSFTGDVVYSGSEVVSIDNSTAYILTEESSQTYLQENFFKHFMRVVLDSFDDYLSF